MITTNSLSRTEYDEDYYSVDIDYSVGPMKHVLDISRFENKDRCNAFEPEVSMYNDPNEVKNDSNLPLGRYGRVIDTESDLRLLQYKLSKNPAKQFMPSNQKSEMVNFVDCRNDMKTQSSRLSNPAIESKSASYGRLVYDDQLRNYQNPLFKQGYQSTDRYTSGNGMNSRLFAKDDFASKNKSYRQ